MNTVRTLSYRNCLDELSQIAQDVCAYCREHKVDPDTALALTLCLNELFTNTVKYAYPVPPKCAKAAAAQATTRSIEVCLRRMDDRMEVHYSDDGHPFNPCADAQCAPDLEVPVAELPTGGFGLYLLRQLSSEIVYSRNGSRNQVRLSFIWR